MTSRLFFQMDDHLVNTGKNPKIAISEGHKWFLRGLLEQGVKRVQIKTFGDHSVCSGCSSFTNVEIDTIEAMKQLPVPSNCSSDYCRCSYRDSRLIREDIKGKDRVSR